MAGYPAISCISLLLMTAEEKLPADGKLLRGEQFR